MNYVSIDQWDKTYETIKVYAPCVVGESALQQ